ncbi:hypothetical protein [Sneathiella limimaris]|uniref:hypothetical protein n=1 Tax=Sneathiella limimaris TaxID=1964213 RepID=UPI00146BB2F9|nr:hypothetical protein [Sneathiella limimaris]
MHLPTRSVIREVYRRQLRQYGSEADQNLDLDDVKLGAALAWPRMMITANKSVDLFELVSSLFTGVLSEQPAPKGNASLAMALAMITLRRNGLMLDVSNEEVAEFFNDLATEQHTEQSLIGYFQKNAIPFQFKSTV